MQGRPSTGSNPLHEVDQGASHRLTFAIVDVFGGSR
jgi:hypothetical protein